MSQLQHPFIYIAALMRTGSTLLSEALTAIPYSFVFHEPHFGKNFFRSHDYQDQMFAEHGIDLVRWRRQRLRIAFVLRRLRRFGFPQNFMVQQLKLLAQNEMFDGQEAQLGVKEVRNLGWENYARVFPDMRVILTGRDPRDVFLSIYELQKRGPWHNKFAVTPDAVSAELDTEFRIQRKLSETFDCLKVRYEDLCTDPAVLESVKHFVDSPIPSSGSIGAFVGGQTSRLQEAAKHNAGISKTSVSRWRQEPDSQKLHDAVSTLRKMPAYAEFWGYAE